MPIYDYSCASCGSFDALRSTRDRDMPAVCPDCGGQAPRAFSFGAKLACGDSVTRRAIETNERAANVPISSRDKDSYMRLRHPSGCGCCSTSAKKSNTRTLSNGNKMFAGTRPWMISH